MGVVSAILSVVECGKMVQELELEWCAVVPVFRASPSVGCFRAFA